MYYKLVNFISQVKVNNFLIIIIMETTKIFGSPGTGKTTKLVDIIMDSGISLDKICYTTLGKKALLEMKERMLSTGVEEENLLFFKTIHAINFKLLGINKKNVIDNAKMKQFCLDKKIKLSCVLEDGNIKEEQTLNDKFFNQMNRDRENLREFNFTHPDFKNCKNEFLKFKQSFFDWMKENDYIDFIGMVEKGIERGVCPPVKMLCVDEWQDLNLLLKTQIMIWMENIGISYHAGDDDQSIYGFAGANVNFFLDLKCNNEIILKESYRLPKNILDLSKYIIEKNINRKKKDFFSKKNDGIILIKSLLGIKDIIKETLKKETCYVLIRNNFLFKQVKDKFVEEGLPVAGFENEKKIIKLFQTIYKKGFFEKEDIDILTRGSLAPAVLYFKRGSKKKITNLTNSFFPKEGYSFRQLINIGLNPIFIKDIENKDITKLKIPNEVKTNLVKLFQNFGYDFNCINIMNIHNAKGLEADNVIIIPYMAGKTFKSITSNNIDEVEAERRVWYVAITRAKYRIILLKENFSGEFFFGLETIFKKFQKLDVAPI